MFSMSYLMKQKNLRLLKILAPIFLIAQEGDSDSEKDKSGIFFVFTNIKNLVNKRFL